MTINKQARTEEVQFELEKAGEVAIVRLVDGNQVEVERDASTTRFQQGHTLGGVVAEFHHRGWAIKEEKTEIPKGIQAEVDEYLEIHEQMSELRKKADKLKNKVRTYMNENEVAEIAGKSGWSVYFQSAKASNSTARYTNYELNEVANVLEGKHLRQVTEIRINADKLEGLLKLGELDKQVSGKIKDLKISNPGTPRFSVRK